jgi:hypothetical protein
MSGKLVTLMVHVRKDRLQVRRIPNGLSVLVKPNAIAARSGRRKGGSSAAEYERSVKHPPVVT